MMTRGFPPSPREEFGIFRRDLEPVVRFWRQGFVEVLEQLRCQAKVALKVP
jgi:hypothetical protein